MGNVAGAAISCQLMRVFGGFNRFDHFQKPAPADNPTVLTGVPVQYRAMLRDRGFHVVVDRKGMDRIDREKTAVLNTAFKALETNAADVPCVTVTAVPSTPP